MKYSGHLRVDSGSPINWREGKKKEDEKKEEKRRKKRKKKED